MEDSGLWFKSVPIAKPVLLEGVQEDKRNEKMNIIIIGIDFLKLVFIYKSSPHVKFYNTLRRQ